MNHIRALTHEESEALHRFAFDHGHTYKAQLVNVYWYNARLWRGGEPSDGATLHALWNDPQWSFHGLKKFRLDNR